MKDTTTKDAHSGWEYLRKAASSAKTYSYDGSTPRMKLLSEFEGFYEELKIGELITKAISEVLSESTFFESRVDGNLFDSDLTKIGGELYGIDIYYRIMNVIKKYLINIAVTVLVPKIFTELRGGKLIFPRSGTSTMANIHKHSFHKNIYFFKIFIELIWSLMSPPSDSKLPWIVDNFVPNTSPDYPSTNVFKKRVGGQMTNSNTGSSEPFQSWFSSNLAKGVNKKTMFEEFLKMDHISLNIIMTGAISMIGGGGALLNNGLSRLLPDGIRKGSVFGINPLFFSGTDVDKKYIWDQVYKKKVTTIKSLLWLYISMYKLAVSRNNPFRSNRIKYIPIILVNAHGSRMDNDDDAISKIDRSEWGGDDTFQDQMLTTRPWLKNEFKVSKTNKRGTCSVSSHFFTRDTKEKDSKIVGSNPYVCQDKNFEDIEENSLISVGEEGNFDITLLYKRYYDSNIISDEDINNEFKNTQKNQAKHKSTNLPDELKEDNVAQGLGSMYITQNFGEEPSWRERLNRPFVEQDAFEEGAGYRINPDHPDRELSEALGLRIRDDISASSDGKKNLIFSATLTTQELVIKGNKTVLEAPSNNWCNELTDIWAMISNCFGCCGGHESPVNIEVTNNDYYSNLDNAYKQLVDHKKNLPRPGQRAQKEDIGDDSSDSDDSSDEVTFDVRTTKRVFTVLDVYKTIKAELNEMYIESNIPLRMYVCSCNKAKEVIALDSI